MLDFRELSVIIILHSELMILGFKMLQINNITPYFSTPKMPKSRTFCGFLRGLEGGKFYFFLLFNDAEMNIYEYGK